MFSLNVLSSITSVWFFISELHRVLYVRGPCWRETGTETGGETPGAAEICVLDQCSCLESRDIVSFI
ncbi:hypothetical protein AMELA_G00023800 [Ameiurus melas]|uniref:Uncharacterized protein n=1 Tax=Ameiurus melas TaxID=219545 RepID=A0A7J6BFX3_AMEME|nr:hypothetical protein AMELA_G00023800 [Ameiurus melas]